MEIQHKSGTKERLFEMMGRVNKISLKENFDVPKEKDQKYLDKSVDTEGRGQVSKKDDGVRYPEQKQLKVSDPSIEGLKGDDLPFNEAVADDQVDDSEALPTDSSDNVDKLEGGLADGANENEFDPEQLSIGLKIEMEHTNDPKIALEIAMDHLSEIPDYYARLLDMEDDAKESGIEQSNGEEAASSPENALLDPSTHWVDHYVPKDVDDVEVSEVNIVNPQVPDDAEAGEDRYRDEEEFAQQAAQQMGGQQQKKSNPHYYGYDRGNKEDKRDAQGLRI